MKKLFFLITSILCIVLQAKVSMSNQNKICLKPESGDSAFFATSVAINDKYLAVGDTGANKVIIYTRNDSGQWLRSGEILPPKNLDLGGDSSMFGCHLELNKNLLAISARTENLRTHIASNHLSRLGKIHARYDSWRYIVNLKTETEVKLIKPIVQKQSDLVRFNLLMRDKIEQFVLPDMGSELFASDFDLYQNLFLVGSPSHTEPGGAWLFDLENLEAKPTKIVPDNINFATISFGETVAISEQFAVIGHRGVLWRDPIRPHTYTNEPHPFAKTLIKNLNNGFTTILDSYGELSLSKNILAVMRPSSPDWEQRPLLEVFYLNDNTTPNLISSQENVSSASVQNGFLISIKRLGDFRSTQVCIEQLNT